MPLKIAVPDNKIFEFLYANFEKAKEKYEIELYKVDEERVDYLFKNNRVDLALLTPLSYAQGVEQHDFRIVAGPCLSLLNYTGTASIFFKKDAKEMKVCMSNRPNDFISIIGKIMLSERYSLDLAIQASKKDKKSILEEADVAILYEKGLDDDISIDISELFFDTFDIPLIAGMWVCRNDEFPFDLHELIHALAQEDLSEVHISEVQDDTRDYDTGDGSLIKHWNEDIEEVLAQTIDLLFYRQFVPEISEVKIMYRD